ncbi:thioredoxin-like protein [Amylostereum chailletii]|nr:thioredoxin-like protein [Amylostereum chailletii]
MNTRQVKLVFISDFACPWCYIGYRHLKAAIQQSKGLNLDFDVEIRPFVLNTCLPPDCSSREGHLIKRYGAEKWAAMKAMSVAKAEEAGITLSLGGPLCDSITSHRLMAKAWELNGSAGQDAVAQRLFKAYNEEDLDISDHDVLSDIAEEAGLMTKESALAFLSTDELLAKVEYQIHEARSKGVMGVPFTVIDGKWAVSGGQTAPVFVKIFTKLAQLPDPSHESDEGTPTGSPVPPDA